MAVTLPLILLIYELLYHPPHVPTGNYMLQWLLREGRAPVIMGLMTAAFAAGLVWGPDSLLANPAYRPVYTWHRFMQTNGGFLDEVLDVHEWFHPSWVLITWGVLAGIAYAAKSRPLAFGWLFAVAGMLPIAFVAPRGGAQYSIPLFGWALYAGSGLASGMAWLWRRIAQDATFRSTRLAATGLFLGILLLLYLRHRT